MGWNYRMLFSHCAWSLKSVVLNAGQFLYYQDEFCVSRMSLNCTMPLNFPLLYRLSLFLSPNWNLKVKNYMPLSLWHSFLNGGFKMVRIFYLSLHYSLLHIFKWWLCLLCSASPYEINKLFLFFFIELFVSIF